MLNGRALALFAAAVAGSTRGLWGWASRPSSSRSSGTGVRSALDFKAVAKDCAGTRARLRYDITIGDERQSVPSDAGITGCGNTILTADVPATEVCEGERPLFAKSAPVRICPHCDGPSTA